MINKKNILIIILVALFTVLLISVFLYKNKIFTVEKMNFEGICLFDIDDTLTTGKDNYRVVQLCIDSGFAVGVCTAGRYWMPNTLKNQPWFPSNLYNFMEKHNFNTFNNVAGGYLMGKHTPQEYIINDKFKPLNIGIPGWRKGFALYENAKMLGIKNPKRMLIFDDQDSFLEGILTYNKNFNAICTGYNCGGELNIQTTKYAISKSLL